MVIRQNHGAGLNLYAYCNGNPLSYADPSGHEQHSAGDNAEKNDGYVQSPEALQQPSVQAWMDKCIKSQMDYVQEGVDAMTNNVYGNDGTSAAPVQSAGMLSDVNSGPKSTALMVIDPPNSLVPAFYKTLDYGALINKGGDTNPSTALAPVAPFGSYEIVLYSDAGTNPLDTAQRSAVAEAVSDAGGESGSNPVKIQFPENPDDFNPEGLRKIGPFGTKNGKIIKWLDENNKAVYEWDEDLTYGSHYHVIGEDGNTRLPNSAGETHFFPGDIFEE